MGGGEVVKHIGELLMPELERLAKAETARVKREARRRIIERLREGRPFGCGRPPGVRP